MRIARTRSFMTATTIGVAAVSLGALGLASISPAQAAEGEGPTIEQVRTDGVGAPHGEYVATLCAVSLKFRDTTYSGFDKYRTSVTDSSGTEVLSETRSNPGEGSGGSPDDYGVVLVCEGIFVEGETYTYTITETSPGGTYVSPPVSHKYEVTRHPATTTLSPTLAGNTQIPAETPISIGYSGGTWEAGTQWTATQLWAPRDHDFVVGENFDPSAEGDYVYSACCEQDVQNTSFTIPAEYIGRDVYFSTTAFVRGKGAWNVALEPLRVVAAGTETPGADKPQPASWVTSYGKVTKNPRVGDVARFTQAPVFSPTAKQAGLKVAYAWVLNNKTLIKGASKPRYKVPAKYRGRTLSVLLVMTADGYQPKYKNIVVGKVRNTRS